MDEALSNARDAITLTINWLRAQPIFWREDMRARGERIPDPVGELVRRVAVEE